MRNSRIHFPAISVLLPFSHDIGAGMVFERKDKDK